MKIITWEILKNQLITDVGSIIDYENLNYSNYYLIKWALENLERELNFFSYDGKANKIYKKNYHNDEIKNILTLLMEKTHDECNEDYAHHGMTEKDKNDINNLIYQKYLTKI